MLSGVDECHIHRPLRLVVDRILDGRRAHGVLIGYGEQTRIGMMADRCLVSACIAVLEVLAVGENHAHQMFVGRVVALCVDADIGVDPGRDACRVCAALAVDEQFLVVPVGIVRDAYRLARKIADVYDGIGHATALHLRAWPPRGDDARFSPEAGVPRPIGNARTAIVARSRAESAKVKKIRTGSDISRIGRVRVWRSSCERGSRVSLCLPPIVTGIDFPLRGCFVHAPLAARFPLEVLDGIGGEHGAARHARLVQRFVLPK